MAVVEAFYGELRHVADEADFYVSVMDRMWGEAVEGDDARRLIQSAIGGLPVRAADD